MYEIRVLCECEYAAPGGSHQYLDLCLPVDQAGPHPVVVWIHGGGWRGGTRAAAEKTWLVRHGYAFASIDYRLSGVAAFPAPLYDCKAALRWLRLHAEAYDLDPDRIGVWGGSAGGHLAALVGLTADDASLAGSDHPGPSCAVQAVCDFCGPSDLTRLANDEIAPDAYELLHTVVRPFLGGAPAEVPDTAKRASPLHHVVPGAPPFLLCHGSRDELVPPDESRRLHEALLAAGGESEFHLLDDEGHGWDPALTDDRVLTFFDRTLKG